MSELYQEVTCIGCGVCFTIEIGRGQPLAAVCNVCERRLNDAVAQRASPEDKEAEHG